MLSQLHHAVTHKVEKKKIQPCIGWEHYLHILFGSKSPTSHVT